MTALTDSALEVDSMAELSRFNGIIIRMFASGKKYNPPYVHVRYENSSADVSVPDGDVVFGNLPDNIKTTVKEWVILHSEELMEAWKTQVFKKIPPPGL